MCELFPLLKASETFRPVQALGRPIFRSDIAEYTMFYAPGVLCVADITVADRFEASLALPGTIENTNGSPNSVSCLGATERQNQHMDWGSELCRRAERAMAQANSWREKRFSPECLTLYMNNECNLHCVYCHTNPSQEPVSRLETEVISKAADVVAVNCRKKGLPLLCVFHGGGEPTLHRERVDHAMTLLGVVASAHDLELSTYVATNGIMSEEKARWLAHRFDLVGLSCDGPADVQNRQRPLWGGRPNSHVLERSGRILRNEGCRIHVRTTITAETLHRQAEIADYICNQFSPEEIHFEPVYVGGRESSGLLIEQAGEFVTHFLKARDIAKRYDIHLTSSGARPGSIHGPYCHVFRSVLNLVPGGLATACFKITEANQVINKGAKIGELNGDTGRFELNHAQILILCKKLDTFLPQCTKCFNRYHCARECPDLCPMDNDVFQGGTSPAPGFRCRVQKGIAYANLQEIAKGLWSVKQAGEAGEVWGVTGQII